MAGSSSFRAFVAGVVLAVLVGTWLRTCGLSSSGLWMDEGFTQVVAQAPLGDIGEATVQLERTPPFYYAAVHLALSWSDSETALRAPSAVFGVLAVVAAAWLGVVAFGRREGGLAALLLAVSSLHVLMSREARAYTAAAFFVTISTGLWLRELRTPGARENRVLYVGASVLGAYTHYLCLACTALQLLCGLAPRGLDGRTPVTRAIVVQRLVVAGAVFILFAPWLSTMLAQVVRRSDALVPVFHGVADAASLRDTMAVQMAGYSLNVSAMWQWDALALGAGCVVLLPWVVGRDLRAAFLAVVCGGTVLLLLGSSALLGLGITHPRYLVVISPLFWVLASRLIFVVASRGWRLLSFTLACALLTLNLVSSVNLIAFEEWWNQDWRGAVALVSRLGHSTDVVLVEPGYAQPVVDRYWRASAVHARYAAVTAPVASALQPRDLPANARIWLLDGGATMVDPTGRVARMLASDRALLLRWEAWRRNPSLCVRASLYGEAAPSSAAPR